MLVLNSETEDLKELTTYRRLLLLAGTIYLFWWLAVEFLLPQSFNPLFGRLVVVILIFAIWGLSFLIAWVRRHMALLSGLGTWLITLHYYYLFYKNGADANWIVGCYVTVIAVNLCLFSARSLVSYSVFVTLLSLALVIFVPALRLSVFLPGLITILAQANLGLWARLGVIKNLADSNERFQLLFNSTFEGVFVHRQGIILNVNDAVAKMSGYSREELLGRNMMDIVHPEERPLAMDKMRQGDVAPYETRGFTKSGKTIAIEVRAKVFTYDNEPAKLVTVQEIEDRKRAEKEKITSLAMAENVRVRDEFISIASHELKTPLSSLKLQVQMIERDIKKGVGAYSAEKLSEFTALFSRQISRLTELVESMLDVSRISSGKLTLSLQKTDLAKLTREVASSLRVHHEHSEIKIEVPEHVWIEADPGRLEQVVENLVTNAIKYGKGQPIRVAVREESNEVLVTVEDHGLGIAPEFTDRIFDRFERAISSRNISGLGLGLYITRQIVEAHQGTITVKSELGSGSKFTVHLPKRKS